MIKVLSGYIFRRTLFSSIVAPNTSWYTFLFSSYSLTRMLFMFRVVWIFCFVSALVLSLISNCISSRLILLDETINKEDLSQLSSQCRFFLSELKVYSSLIFFHFYFHFHLLYSRYSFLFSSMKKNLSCGASPFLSPFSFPIIVHF